MLEVHPQYIKDADGNESLVILPANEFDAIMEELEEMEDVEQAFSMIEAKRKKIGYNKLYGRSDNKN